MKRVSIGVTLHLLLVALAACTPVQVVTPPQPQAVAGVLDLLNWDFARNGVVNLNGAWEFYWEQLLTEADFTASPPPRADRPDPGAGHVAGP
jgi:hypothetical protein